MKNDPVPSETIYWLYILNTVKNTRRKYSVLLSTNTFSWQYEFILTIVKLCLLLLRNVMNS